MRKVCLIIDSFKGSASSPQIEDYVERGIRRAERPGRPGRSEPGEPVGRAGRAGQSGAVEQPDGSEPAFAVTKIPISDGGEGFASILTEHLGGQLRHSSVSDPFGRPVCAAWGLVGPTAIVEMAETAGLAYRQPDDDPLQASTHGLGELIAQILVDQPTVRKVIIGLGGSATSDAGLGMAQALGYRFLDEQGTELRAVPAVFARLATVDASAVNPAVRGVDFVGFADVDSPLSGPTGAIAVFGRQKGIRPEDFARVDRLLAHAADRVDASLGTDFRSASGSGAAGGLGYGIRTFLGGQVRNTMSELIDLFGIEAVIRSSDLVVTGEGCLDYQSLEGKAPGRIAQLAQSCGVPVISLSGAVKARPADLYAHGFTACFTTTVGAKPIEKAMADIEEDAIMTSEQVFRLLAAVRA